jgi:two-component system cell cycle response regulator DivK
VQFYVAGWADTQAYLNNLRQRRDSAILLSNSTRRRPIIAANARCDVLIVEDSTIQCLEMADYLRHANLVVETAFDGAAALHSANKYEPRVVLLDYNLPDMTGVQLAEAMRALLPSTAILIMSGRIDGLSEETLQALGITIFVNKPVPLGPLRQAVVKLVAESSKGEAAPKPKGWLSTGTGGTRH